MRSYKYAKLQICEVTMRSYCAKLQIRTCKDTKLQRYEVANIRSCKDTKLQRYKVAKIQSYDAVLFELRDFAA